jgi:copper(I)-binding protein
MFGRLLAASSLFLVAACGQEADVGIISVENAVVTVPAVPGAPGAAYFELSAARGGSRLVAIESPRAERIELHQTRTENGRTSMAPARPEALDFMLGEPLVFAPGGKHAMVFGLDPAVRVGDRVPLTFRTEGFAPRTVEAEVRGPGQAHASH